MRIGSTLILLAGLLIIPRLEAQVTPSEAWEQDFQLISKQIALRKPNDPKHQAYNKMIESQAFRQDAMILDSDRDAASVILRRTEALLEHLQKMQRIDKNKLQPLMVRFKALTAASIQIPVDHRPERKALYVKACRLRREIAFTNPLLDFNRIVFIKRHRARYQHMVDQYFGYNAIPGGGVFILHDPFGTKPKVLDVLATTGKHLRKGAFLSLDLDYSGKRIAFAWTQAKRRINNDTRKAVSEWYEDSVYHIFTADIDGQNLKQLTRGKWNDFDPCFLPNGRIAFVSERRGGQVRCSQRPCPCYTVHDMKDDGSNIRILSYHDTNEWHPSVDNDGRLIYCRWDYVDRAPNIAHHLWTSYPDGRDPRSLHGNYPNLLPDRTFAELSMRAIPGSHKYLVIAAPHHGQSFGSIILLDQRIPDDNYMSQVKRVTPTVPMPEADVATRKYKKSTPRPPFNLHGKAEIYGTPWPLSEDFYLAVYDLKGSNYGLYLVDSFGNRELLYRDPKIACNDPIPLRPRKRPPVLPPMTDPHAQEGMGTVAVMNVYEGDYEWPEGVKITALRVIQLFPRPTYKQAQPNIGAARQSMARGVLGTVPVETDGSVYFEAPAGKQFYFQALDENGMAVQSMRSGTYIHPGQRLSCIGCHENKWHPPKLSKAPIALSKPPRKLKPDVSGSYPVSFPLLVQPVLDAKCQACHQKEKKAPSLSSRMKTGKDTWGWSEAMHTLYPFGNFQGGRANSITLPYTKGGGARSVPGKVGAHGSRLYTMLKKGHHKVVLTKEELHRITLWLDTNCVFYGAYRDIGEQCAGKRVMPLLE